MSGLQGSCAICFEDLQQADKISALVCGHIYHNRCISQWMAAKKQCPNCRRSVPKNGFIEKLFFDVQRFDGETRPERPPDVDYRDEHHKLSVQLKLEKEKSEQLNLENADLKSTVKGLEKKVIREKDKFKKEVPKLQATIHHLTISSEETDYLKRELKEVKNKLKICDFYKILTIHNDDADKQLGEYLKKNGNFDTEKFFQLMKAQNKDLTEKRREAAREIEQLKNELHNLKNEKKEDAATIKVLKKTVSELRERANVETPITNKRLRNVMESETPPPAKRISMGFDETTILDTSFVKENKTPSSAPKMEKSKKFNFDDSEDDEYFRTPKIAEKPKKVEKKPANDSFDFDFDIPVPSTIINRIPTIKSTSSSQVMTIKPKIPNLDSQKSKKAPPTQKGQRLSTFFPRTQSLQDLKNCTITLD